MKSLITIIAITLVFTIPTFAHDDEVNVLNYYAVGNSLDGQPLVDRTNLLRFYPVYALRDEVKRVTVTLYYGSSVAIRDADRKEKGKYWEILLPKFQLGEAIQRIEVDTKTHINIDAVVPFNLFNQLKENIDAIDKSSFLDKLGKNYNREFQIITGCINKFDTLMKIVRTDYGINESNNKKYNEFKKSLTSISDSLIDVHCAASPSLVDFKKKIDSIRIGITSFNIDKTCDSDYLNKNIDKLSEIRDSLVRRQNDVTSIVKKISDATYNTTDLLKKQILSVDSINQLFIKNNITPNINDTNYVGIGVRPSDIKFSDNKDTVYILYRNYKQELRKLPALDPSERLGIFRARYIPFAIVGYRFNRPFQDAQSMLFEVGLSFGDPIVSGDDFIKPVISFERLGVAFLVTPKLFANDALYRGLAITYDFNSFGSVGVGVNFPGEKSTIQNDKRIIQNESYFSFGINKKAFEYVLGQLQTLFE